METIKTICYISKKCNIFNQGIKMDVETALKSRKSVRAFLNKPVTKETIIKILDAARWAPSGVNAQPWHVAVVSGNKKQQIEQKLLEAFENGVPKEMDYQYYPLEWKEPYKTRRKECGLLMYKTLGITREDKEQQRERWAANYRAFDAPVALYFFIDPAMQKGSYLDFGMFLQSIMLMATAEGLGTCAQAALAEHPDIVKKELGYEDYNLLCGMALGYEDKDALVNSYRTPRLTVDEFTKFFE